MKNWRGGLSNVLVLVFLVGLAAVTIAFLSNQKPQSAGPGSSPVATAVGIQVSPLLTPAASNVPSAQIGKPVLLQASGRLGQLNQAPDKLVNIAGEKGTVLLDPTNGLTRTLAPTGLINAHVSNHWLVYEDRPPLESSAYYSRIKAIDLDSGKEILMGNENDFQSDPTISGNVVAWDEARNGEKSGIYAYDLSAGKKITVVAGEGTRGYPRISGPWIVYIQWPSKSTGEKETVVELRAHSLKTDEDFLIGLLPFTQDSWALSRYAIDGDKVVWTKQTSSSQYTYELHLYDLATRSDRPLTNPQQWPLASLSLSTQSGLVAFNNNGKRTVLDWLQPEPTNVSVTPPEQAQWGYELSVAGNYLVWQIPRNSDYSDGQIFVSRVSR